MMRSRNCTTGLSAKFVVVLHDQQLALTANESVLYELIGKEPVTMEESLLANQLFSLQNILACAWFLSARFVVLFCCRCFVCACILIRVSVWLYLAL
jgi:5-formaminoimidazole-4-carboxamide-1-beta-D-ribofuranosyl 5'-monophosphate synthetase